MSFLQPWQILTPLIEHTIMFVFAFISLKMQHITIVYVYRKPTHIQPHKQYKYLVLSAGYLWQKMSQPTCLPQVSHCACTAAVRSSHFHTSSTCTHTRTHLRPLYNPIHVPDSARVPLPQSEKCQAFSLLCPPIPAFLHADKGHE